MTELTESELYIIAHHLAGNRLAMTKFGDILNTYNRLVLPLRPLPSPNGALEIARPTAAPVKAGRGPMP